MPVNFLLDVIFGTVCYSISKDEAGECINLLRKSNIIASKIKSENEDKFCFTVRKRRSDKVKSLLDKWGIKVYSIKGKGLPFWLYRYRRRYGFFLGAALLVASVWVSGQFVWQITFSGNENIPDHKVEEMLLDSGFGVGSYIAKTDLYTLCNRFLQQTEDFSYISVNMEGTTAKVQLRERKTRDEKQEYEASNLVAKYSGQIESMTVYSGKTVIEKEAVVKEGDILVSGFMEKKNGFDIVRSTGNVYAYVTRTFSVDIPYEKDVKVYTGKGQTRYNIEFFGKAYNIRSDIDGSIKEYDSKTDRERLVLFDKIKLPLVLSKTSHSEYRLEKMTVTPEEAKGIAEMEMSRIMVQELADSEILEVKPKAEENENSYKLTYEVYCLTDIAEEKEIIIDKQ